MKAIKKRACFKQRKNIDQVQESSFSPFRARAQTVSSWKYHDVSLGLATPLDTYRALSGGLPFDLADASIDLMLRQTFITVRAGVQSESRIFRHISAQRE